MFQYDKYEEIFKVLESAIDQKEKDLLIKGTAEECKIDEKRYFNYRGYFDKSK